MKLPTPGAKQLRSRPFLGSSLSMVKAGKTHVSLRRVWQLSRKYFHTMVNLRSRCNQTLGVERSGSSLSCPLSRSARGDSPAMTQEYLWMVARKENPPAQMLLKDVNVTDLYPQKWPCCPSCRQAHLDEHFTITSGESGPVSQPWHGGNHFQSLFNLLPCQI